MPVYVHTRDRINTVVYLNQLNHADIVPRNLRNLLHVCIQFNLRLNMDNFVHGRCAQYKSDAILEIEISHSNFHYVAIKIRIQNFYDLSSPFDTRTRICASQTRHQRSYLNNI